MFVVSVFRQQKHSLLDFLRMRTIHVVYIHHNVIFLFKYLVPFYSLHLQLFTNSFSNIYLCNIISVLQLNCMLLFGNFTCTHVNECAWVKYLFLYCNACRFKWQLVPVLFSLFFLVSFTVICAPSMPKESLSCPGTCSWPGESVDDMMGLVDWKWIFHRFINQTMEEHFYFLKRCILLHVIFFEQLLVFLFFYFVLCNLNACLK